MKTEARIETVDHPTEGGLTKKFVYTWDETRFLTLQQAIDYVNPEDETEKGYVNKELYVAPPKVDLKGILQSATPEEIEFIKQILNG